MLTFLVVSLLESADEAEEVLSLVLVADVLLDDDDGVDTFHGFGHLLNSADGHLLSFNGGAGHAGFGGLK